MKIAFLICFFIALISSSVSIFASSENEKRLVLSNLKEISFSRDEGAPKLTHFSQSITDLSKNKDKDCDVIFKEIRAFLPIETRKYFSLASFYCLQPANENGVHIAKLLKIDHIVESSGSELSSKELNYFLNRFKSYKFYDQTQNYYPVELIEKARVLNARHSFETLETLLSDEFIVPVKNIEEFILEGESFVKNINFKDKEIYTSQMKSYFGESASRSWIELFNNPEADVFSFFLNQIRIVVRNNETGLKQDYISPRLFSEDNFVDTRWDEFIEPNSSNFVLKTANYVMEKICVNVDTQKTEDPHYNNIAQPLGEDLPSLDVFPNKVLCFDYDKSYYMMHFLKTQGNSIWYGTTCRYLPYKRHQGKTLYYRGEHGQYKCPVY